jgi:hypothetical protein
MSDFLTNNWTEHNQQGKDRSEEMEGRVRALEAIILEMPEVTPDRIRAAKERLRAEFRSCHQRNSYGQGTIELLDKINAPYDKHAEASLDKLAREAEIRLHPKEK